MSFKFPLTISLMLQFHLTLQSTQHFYVRGDFYHFFNSLCGINSGQLTLSVTTGPNHILLFVCLCTDSYFGRVFFPGEFSLGNNVIDFLSFFVVFCCFVVLY